MASIDIRFDLIKKIESLDRKRLEEVYGIILNFLNNKKEIGEETMSSYEKRMLDEGLKEIDEGKGVAHEEVINKYRRKYSK